MVEGAGGFDREKIRNSSKIKSLNSIQKNLSPLVASFFLPARWEHCHSGTQERIRNLRIPAFAGMTPHDWMWAEILHSVQDDNMTIGTTTRVCYTKPMPAPHSILITRPRQDAEPLANTLRGLGYDVHADPLITTQFQEDSARQGLERALAMRVQAILITSANGVRGLAKLTHRRDIPIITIGEHSKHVARKYGFERIICATDEDPGLSHSDIHNFSLFVRNKCKTSRGVLLHLCGTPVAENLDKLLVNAGFVVQRVTLYEDAAVDALSQDHITALTSGRVAVAMFYAIPTTQVYLDLLVAAGLQPCLAQLHALCQNHAVADAVRAHSTAALWRGVHVAADVTNESMLHLLHEIAPS